VIGVGRRRSAAAGFDLRDDIEKAPIPLLVWFLSYLALVLIWWRPFGYLPLVAKLGATIALPFLCALIPDAFRGRSLIAAYAGAFTPLVLALYLLWWGAFRDWEIVLKVIVSIGAIMILAPLAMGWVLLITTIEEFYEGLAWRRREIVEHWRTRNSQPKKKQAIKAAEAVLKAHSGRAYEKALQIVGDLASPINMGIPGNEDFKKLLAHADDSASAAAHLFANPRCESPPGAVYRQGTLAFILYYLARAGSQPAAKYLQQIDSGAMTVIEEHASDVRQWLVIWEKERAGTTTAQRQPRSEAVGDRPTGTHQGSVTNSAAWLKRLFAQRVGGRRAWISKTVLIGGVMTAAVSVRVVDAYLSTHRRLEPADLADATDVLVLAIDVEDLCHNVRLEFPYRRLARNESPSPTKRALTLRNTAGGGYSVSLEQVQPGAISGRNETMLVRYHGSADNRQIRGDVKIDVPLAGKGEGRVDQLSFKSRWRRP
jgi:hypothetical protein